MVISTGITVTQPAPPTAVPPNGWNLDGYYFDAWLHLQHEDTLEITSHPVQTGANISDHCFDNARQWTFEIGTSDVAKAIPSPDPKKQVMESPTRGIGAYNTLVDLKRQHRFLKLDSKYGHYENILIKSITAPDDYRTSNSSRISITLQEVIVANATTVQVSAQPAITDTTQKGDLKGQALGDQAQASLNKSAAYVTDPKNISGFAAFLLIPAGL